MRRSLHIAVGLLLAFWGIVLSSSTSIADDSPRRVALVIGNAHYENVPRLANPTNDAKLVATTLRDLGFELIGGGPQLDLDRVALERAIRDFSHHLSSGSVGFFYYSGHGVQLRGANFLLPIGANPITARDADFEFVDVNLLLRQMEDSGTSLNIVILDACRNNPFGGRGLKDVSTGLAQMQAPRGTVIAYSTQPGGVAADGEGADSPYTTELVRLMKSPGLGILNMFNEVAVAVDKVTNHAQQPWTALSPINQDFYLAGAHSEHSPGPASSPPSVGTLPSVPQAATSNLRTDDREVIFWQAVQNSGSVAELKAYMRQYPDGLFVEIARARIATLERSATAEPTSQVQQLPPTPQDVQQQALATIPPMASPPPANTMGQAQIAEAQRLLTGMGLVPGETNGKLGPHTRDAVRAFQISAHIPDDGEVSDALLTLLHAPPPGKQARAAALENLAEEAVRAGNVPNATRLYVASVGLDPANARALIALGDLQKSIGSIEGARRSFLRAAQSGGPLRDESLRRLASLPQPAKSVPTQANTSGTQRPQPLSQSADTASVPADTPGTARPGVDGPRKIWVVTASSMGYSGNLSGGPISMTATDPVKETAEVKALKSCAKYAPFGYATTCRVSSELERDAKQ